MPTFDTLVIVQVLSM